MGHIGSSAMIVNGPTLRRGIISLDVVVEGLRLGLVPMPFALNTAAITTAAASPLLLPRQRLAVMSPPTETRYIEF